MAKTDKFNSMIEAFECDFVLAKEGKYSISELENKVIFKDEKLMADIDLLEELSYLLRYGKAEIHLIEEPKTKADKIRAMTDEELAKTLTDDIPCKMCEYWSKEISSCDAPFSFLCTKGYAEALFLQWLQSEAE